MQFLEIFYSREGSGWTKGTSSLEVDTGPDHRAGDPDPPEESWDRCSCTLSETILHHLPVNSDPSKSVGLTRGTGEPLPVWYSNCLRNPVVMKSKQTHTRTVQETR